MHIDLEPQHMNIGGIAEGKGVGEEIADVVEMEKEVGRESTINSNSETLQSSNNGTLKSNDSQVDSATTAKEAVQIPLIYMHSHHPTNPMENLCKDPNCPMNKPQSESGVASSPEQQQEMSYQYLRQYYEQYSKQPEYQPKLDNDTLTKLEDFLNVQSKLREREPGVKGPDAYNVEILNEDEEVDVQSSISQQDLLKRRLARNKYLEQIGQETGQGKVENEESTSEFDQPEPPHGFNGYGFPNGFNPALYGPRPGFRGPFPFGPGPDSRFPPEAFQYGYGYQGYYDRERGPRSRVSRGPRQPRRDDHRQPEYPPRFHPHDNHFFPNGFGNPPFEYFVNRHNDLAPPQPPQPPAPPVAPQLFRMPTHSQNSKERSHRSRRAERGQRQRGGRKEPDVSLMKPLEKDSSGSDSSSRTSSTDSHVKENNSDVAEPSEFADGGSERSFEGDNQSQHQYQSDSSHTYNNSHMNSYGGYPYPYQVQNDGLQDPMYQQMQNLAQYHGNLNSEMSFKSSELAAVEAEIQAEIIRKQIELGNMPNKSYEEKAKFRSNAMELVNLQVSLEKRRAKAKAEISKVQAEIFKVQANQAKAQADMVRKKLDNENTDSSSTASIRHIKEVEKSYNNLEKGFLKEASKLDSKAKAYDERIEGFDAKMKHFDERMKRFDSKVQNKLKKIQKESEPKKEKEGFFSKWTSYFRGEVQKGVNQATAEVQKNISEAAEEVTKELTNAANEVRSELGMAAEKVADRVKPKTDSLKSKNSNSSVEVKRETENEKGEMDELPNEAAEKLKRAFAELLTEVDSPTENEKSLPQIPEPAKANVETSYKVKVLGSDMKVKKVTGPGKFQLSVTVSDDEDNK
ncbi:hypothetical protein HDV01_005359 [Terramyces sp. JEL0728]|nr:hypothetical protein HDV01_005359 [Terramyces sp. JEL0728]